MTTKLALYNKAGALLKQERVALADDVLLVRELDAVYDEVLKACLEEGQWNWAIRVAKLDYDPALDPGDDFVGGPQYGYTLPDDYVQLVAISTTADFNPNNELHDYDLTGPGKLLYSTRTTFFLKYISSDSQFGLDLSKWSETYANAVGGRLAEAVALRVTKSEGDRSAAEKYADVQIAKAKIRDAVAQPVKRKPTGNLVRARLGYRPRSLRQDSYN